MYGQKHDMGAYIFWDVMVNIELFWGQYFTTLYTECLGIVSDNLVGCFWDRIDPKTHICL